MCSESKLPHPSSIAMKLGRGNADTFISAMRIANDEMAELCQKYPDRFVGFAAAVHLGDVDAAIREAERSVKQLGAKGVLIYNHVAGLPLDDKRFRPFFAKWLS